MISEPNEIDFLAEWLNHLNLEYTKGVAIPRTKQSLDIMILRPRIGVLCPNWNKPISVSIVHQAIHAYEQLGLNKVFIIADDISLHAENTLERLKYPIAVIQSYELSEIILTFQPLVENMEKSTT